MSHHLKQHNTDNEPVSQPNSNASIDVCVSLLSIHSLLWLLQVLQLQLQVQSTSICRFQLLDRRTDGRTDARFCCYNMNELFHDATVQDAHLTICKICCNIVEAMTSHLCRDALNTTLGNSIRVYHSLTTLKLL